MAVAVKTTSTVAEMLVRIADALNEQSDQLDLYSVVAPVVIDGYADIDAEELGFVPGGSFGRHDYGTYAAIPAKGVQATVDMFMGLIQEMKLVSQTYEYSRVTGRKPIDTAPIDLAYRLHSMGLKLAEAGYPQGSWRISTKDGSCDVLSGFTDLNDPRLLYVVSQLEEVTGVDSLNAHGLNVVASHMLTTYDAHMTKPGKNRHIAYVKDESK